MAQVLYQYDIKTPSPDVDAEAMVKMIREKLPEGFTMQDKPEIKPMFFGIKAAVCQFIIPEDDGLQDKLENFLTDLDGLGEYELTFTTRL
ncbi:MAG: hypothetical protein GPJ54_13840 [Candidatus Heimdallarchaeota archaeon]|nr:hypothetical protein [Candidatus Heimdallarchaeota archaeon]